MMKVIRVLKVSAAVLGLSLAAGIALADCTIDNGYAPMVLTQPLLGGNLTVGRDIPLGAEVYRQTFTGVSEIKLTCSAGNNNVTTEEALPIIPFPLSSFNSPPWGGKVYQTGVPGIGVVITILNRAFPNTSQGSNCGVGSGTCRFVFPGYLMDFQLLLIKIGDVSPGTIQGSQLPTMSRTFVNSNRLEYQRVNFSGNINIVSRTCQTPDVTVQMGTHKVSEFSGKNSATAWKDFSIALNNCPAFHGYYQGTGPDITSAGAISNLASRKNNVLQVELWPTQDVISLNTLSINETALGTSPAATGIGLQIADSTGAPLDLITAHASGISPLAVDGASYVIPLKARYIQTEDNITPGPANVTATFNIYYY